MTAMVRMLAYGEQFGGAERQIVTLCGGLIERGIPVSCHLQFDRDLAERLRGLGCEVHDLSTRSLRRNIDDIAHRVYEDRPPIIHAHNTRSSVLASLVHARHRTPIVKTEHGAAPTGGSSATERLKSRLGRSLEVAGLRAAGAEIVFVSRDLQQLAGWAAPSRSRVIPNGVVLPAKVPARPAELRESRFNVVFAGRLEAVKAPLAAIAAMAALPAGSRAHLLMLGDGPLKSEVLAAAAAPEVQSKVTLLGFRPDALSFIAHADAVVLPSLHEGLPFVALEALALGTPLIASRVGGLQEYLIDRQTVLFTTPGEAVSVSTAIREAECDEALRARLVNQGRTMVRENLSGESMVSAYVALYEQAIDRSHHATRPRR